MVAALDCVGTDEAVDVSLALCRARPHRHDRRQGAGRGRGLPGDRRGDAGERRRSATRVRADLLRLAGEGRLEVPVARTFPLADAVDAATFLQQGHPGGKLALLP